MSLFVYLSEDHLFSLTQGVKYVCSVPCRHSQDPTFHFHRAAKYGTYVVFVW